MSACGCVVVTVQDLVTCAVHHSGQPPKAIADFLGVRVGYLYDAANPDRDELQFQLKHLVPLLTFTRRHDLADALASMLGGVYFQLPALDGVQAARIADETATLTSEVADVFRESAKAMASQRMTPVLAQRLHREGRDLIAQTARLMRLADDLAGVPAQPLVITARRSA
jgi:hypothetical protein